MSPDLELRGHVASDGIFAGPVVHLDVARKARTHSGSAARERDVLKGAIRAAIAEISGLMGSVTGEAADVLGFQSAMLEDEALTEPALAAIAAGSAADSAWAEALAGEIAGYESSAEEYFRARAADLRDIRDRVLRHVSGDTPEPAATAAVFVGEDIAPSRFLETDWSTGGAIALWRGSTTSHVAMLARARGVPMIVGLGQAPSVVAREAIVDAMSGCVVLNPSDDTRSKYAGEMARLAITRRSEARMLLQPARRADGRRIDLLVNAASVEELDRIDPESCDGIGLVRSEFLFSDGKSLPDEETQYQSYRRFVAWANGKPVTIRTLDVGGDKPMPGFAAGSERNPFLGLRGVRLTLARRDVFRTQLRAFARAAVHGNLKAMIPMVTVPEELSAAGALLDQCVAELTSEGIACARPPLGIMVEVPAVAVCPELFAAASFFSIGSNDLTQYVTAAARDDAAVAPLADPFNPAVMKLMRNVVSFSKIHEIPVSLCGDMASDPRCLGALLDLGLTSFSVAPARIGRIKAALAEA